MYKSMVYASVCFAFFTSQLYAHVTTVPEVDFEKYVGTWHQVAAIPAWFQRKCRSEITANYKMLDNGEIKVINKCKKANGSYSKAVGQARVNPKFASSSKLSVSFVKFFKSWLWFLGGDYWVLDLAQDYSYSVVGGPKLKYLWILSRTRTMELEKLLKIRQKIEEQGYDSCKVIITQKNTLQGSKLCNL